jgi:hypothetical protein
LGGIVDSKNRGYRPLRAGHFSGTIGQGSPLATPVPLPNNYTLVELPPESLRNSCVSLSKLSGPLTPTLLLRNHAKLKNCIIFIAKFMLSPLILPLMNAFMGLRSPLTI